MFQQSRTSDVTPKSFSHTRSAGHGRRDGGVKDMSSREIFHWPTSVFKRRS